MSNAAKSALQHACDHNMLWFMAWLLHSARLCKRCLWLRGIAVVDSPKYCGQIGPLGKTLVKLSKVLCDRKWNSLVTREQRGDYRGQKDCTSKLQRNRLPRPKLAKCHPCSFSRVDSLRDFRREITSVVDGASKVSYFWNHYRQFLFAIAQALKGFPKIS